jgi:hypothetical protein
LQKIAASTFYSPSHYAIDNINNSENPENLDLQLVLFRSIEFFSFVLFVEFGSFIAVEVLSFHNVGLADF